MSLLNDLRRGVARVVLGSAPVDDWNNVNNPAVFNIVGLARKTASGIRVTELTAMNIPVVWACVSILARQISQCPIALYKQEGDQRSRVTDHPISMLLAEPNTLAGLGMPDLLKQKQTSEGLWGSAFWQIERSTATGAPVALWPLESAVTTPLTGDAIDARGITGYDTLVGKKSERLPAEDVIHFRGVTLTGYTGWSPVAAAAQAIGLTQAMEKFGAEFFSNEAKSGGFIMHPGKLNPAGKEAIRKSVEDQARKDRGPGNTGGGKEAGTSGKESHRVKILDEGMKFIPTTISPNEAQFIEARNHQVSEIARLYGVPLVLLQSQDGSTVWGTGIESLMLGFVNQTIRPILVASEDELSRKLLTADERAEGYHVAFDYSVLLRGDSVARADYNNKGIEGGWLTPNEARIRENMNPLPGLDKPTPKAAPAAPGAPGQKPPAKQPAE